MDDPIVAATWGLVLVTALLVVATLVPLITELLKRRDEKAEVAAKTVPDLNILRSRLEGSTKALARPTELAEIQVETFRMHAGKDLEMLAPIISVRSASLTFTNELFILRHLLTRAYNSLDQAESLFDESDAATVRRRDDLLRDARRYYAASVLTLDAAEALLPRRHSTISGERFWDRFSRVSKERETLAAKNLVSEGPVSPRGQHVR